MSALFNEFLYQPIFNLLVFLYNIVPGHDLGVAIILLTLLIKIVFLPLSLKTLRSQKQMQDIQPKLKEVQEKYKHDKQTQAQAVMQLYKENNVNPLSGCFPLLVQIPILVAVYRVLINGFKPETLDLLYGFISRPEAINSMAFNFLDLSLRNPVLALISGALQFVQMRKTSQKTASVGNEQAAAMTKQMLYFFPIMIIVIAWNLPAGLVLYWTTTTLFSVFEQTLVYKDGGK